MKTILYIEPNTVLAKLYKRGLEQEGYKVVCVAGAQAGIDAADEHAPDLVILELQLSKHSGLEFLHEFRSYPEWAAVPVIVNTVITPSRFAGKYEPLQRDLGIAAVLYKPKASLTELLNAVRKHLAP